MVRERANSRELLLHLPSQIIIHPPPPLSPPSLTPHSETTALRHKLRLRTAATHQTHLFLIGSSEGDGERVERRDGGKWAQESSSERKQSETHHVHEIARETESASDRGRERETTSQRRACTLTSTLLSRLACYIDLRSSFVRNIIDSFHPFTRLLRSQEVIYPVLFTISR